MAKKKKGGPSPKKVRPFDVWKNKTIRALFTWDNGEGNLKGDPTPGTFKLVAEKVPNGSGGKAIRFRLKFDTERMPPYWEFVVLQPLGTKKAPGPTSPLSPLDSLSKEEIQEKLVDLVEELNVEQTDVRRLEGFIPVASADPAHPKLDEVRMVYLPKILRDKDDDERKRDFVFINFRSVSGGEEPNGGGSGPPD